MTDALATPGTSSQDKQAMPRTGANSVLRKPILAHTYAKRIMSLGPSCRR
jgi:hypothetical protein